MTEKNDNAVTTIDRWKSERSFLPWRCRTHMGFILDATAKTFGFSGRRDRCDFSGCTLCITSCRSSWWRWRRDTNRSIGHHWHHWSHAKLSIDWGDTNLSVYRSHSDLTRHRVAFLRDNRWLYNCAIRLLWHAFALVRYFCPNAIGHPSFWSLHWWRDKPVYWRCLT